VDSIHPVLPVFGLPQINPIIGTRSVAADIMHLTEHLQGLFFQAGQQLCPKHRLPLKSYEISTAIQALISKKSSEKDVFYILTSRDSFITHLQNTPFPSRSLASEDALVVEDFDKGHEFWELIRFKQKHINNLEKKMLIYKENKIPLYLFQKESQTFIEIKFDDNVYCPKCDFEGLSNYSMSHFSPYNALGACNNCQGFGATLEYDEEKLFNKELSLKEEGIKFLYSKRFLGLPEKMMKVAKKKKISITKNLIEQDQAFWSFIYDGEGEWPGVDAILKYYEGKRYKANVRIFLRGIQKEVLCSSCNGSRVNPDIDSFHLFHEVQSTYYDLSKMNIEELLNFFTENRKSLNAKSTTTDKLFKKILNTLQLACDIGLGHLQTNRKSKSVSAGEYQRLLLLKYFSYEGTGALFIFDEPSLGLADDECKKLLTGFNNLIAQGNTIIIIDHLSFFQKKSDYFILMGPGAGINGGKVMFEGDFNKLVAPKKEKVQAAKVIDSKRNWIEVKKPKVHDKEFASFKLPLNEIVHVKGRSGSGKSACLVNTLANHIHHDLKGQYLNKVRGIASSIKYKQDFEDIIIVDANLNRYTNRSTVGSMTSIFTVVRRHFLKTPYAKSMGLKEGHLSSNSELGQCPKCEGKGVNIVEMQFLEDIILECEDCRGRKLKPLYADLTAGNLSLYEAYSRPLNEVIDQIELTPKFRRIWEFMKILKLDYLSLERTVSSLSGGEKQRLYLLSRLQKEVKNSIVFFENISFGLSHNELVGMCKFMHTLTKQDNSVIVIDQDPIFGEVASYSIEMK